MFKLFPCTFLSTQIALSLTVLTEKGKMEVYIHSETAETAEIKILILN